MSPRRTTVKVMGAFILFASYAHGQSSSVSAPTPSQGQIARPTTTGVIGQQDPGAVAELAAHMAAVGGGRWAGMQGSGTITSADDLVGQPATLSNQGAYKFRLDQQTSSGQVSIRLDRFTGKTQLPNGKPVAMPSDSLLGIFPFELARTADHARKALSLKDQGLTTTGGRQLHRITLERLTIGTNPSTNRPNTQAVDLYFDPVSHLLQQTVASVPVGPKHVSLLSVVTYSDYRQVGKSLVPFCFTETLEGQPYRTFQLTSLQLEPVLDDTYFTF